MVEPPPLEATVIRFPSMKHDRVESRALQAFRECGSHRISVFLGVSENGEDEDRLHARLIEAAGLEGMNLESLNWIFVSKVESLISLGFSFEKDGHAGERREHYSVNVNKNGADLQPMDICQFIAAFTDKRRAT